jgi:hypothetical protein
MYVVNGVETPAGHGPWCGCATCQACAGPVPPYAVAVELYRAELKRRDVLVNQLQKRLLRPDLDRAVIQAEQDRVAIQAELRDDRLLTIAALERANAVLRSQLDGTEYQRQPPPFRPNPALYDPASERRSPAFTMAIVGMLVALAIVTELLFWFH